MLSRIFRLSDHRPHALVCAKRILVDMLLTQMPCMFRMTLLSSSAPLVAHTCPLFMRHASPVLSFASLRSACDLQPGLYLVIYWDLVVVGAQIELMGGR